MEPGEIPVLIISEDTIPRAYERAIKEVWEKGASVKTEYDHPEDPPSKDATVVIIVRQPFGQPRFHRSFADGLGGLAEYVMEVVHGAHDYWVKPVEEILKGKESKDTRWTYTYHGRLFEYRIEDKVVNQIGYMIDKLSQTGYSRRAQAITWNPKLDPPTDDPPCLQRLWGRLCEDGKGGYVFNMNSHWRSRDLFKAWFENVIALTTLMRKIAEALAEKTGKNVRLGRYVDISDSLHIYGSYFKEIEGDPKKGIRSFFETLESRSFEERTWDSEFIKPHFIDDGLGKGLRRMLEREKDMPQNVRKAIEEELRQMEKKDYVV
ncbi:MAG: thymidylate synthase [Candidatus Aminicenantes bacterium]|nr:thymidylate synthase [Candidatus Aminicenantes bacterium]MDH5706544.1 thymidylate synthase [Candidatus Aminicenantes bacterium]